MTDLSARIAATLAAAEPRPDALASLIAESETALTSANEELASARARALDPLAAPTQVAGARGDAFDAEFRAARLGVALDHLKAKHAAAVERVRDAERNAEVARVTAERDELAEDLRARYPALVAELAILLTRIRASNTDCNRLGLLDVESTARGPMAPHSPSLIRGCRLVDFDIEAQVPIWPPTHEHRSAVVQLRQTGEAVSAARHAAAAAAG